MADIKKGEAFMKEVFKSSIIALFAIGVRSQENIDKFLAEFENALYQNLGKIGFFAEGRAEEIKEESLKEEPKEPTQDLGKLNLNLVLVGVLKKAGITSIEKLLTEMQKRDLKEIKGVGDKSVEEIRKAVKEWKG